MDASPRDDWSFANWMDSVRAGDENATAELVRRYEPAILKAIRAPLLRYRLNRFIDAADISQIVLTSFFFHLANGRFELTAPEQILKLLLTMARKQVGSELRYYTASRRDIRRLDENYSEHNLHSLVDPGFCPRTLAAVKESIQELFRRFAPLESHITEQRLKGRTWLDLANEVGGTPEGVRKKYERALERIATGFYKSP